MDRGTWRAIVHGVTESDMIKHTHTQTQREREREIYINREYRNIESQTNTFRWEASIMDTNYKENISLLGPEALACAQQ